MAPRRYAEEVGLEPTAGNDHAGQGIKGAEGKERWEKRGGSNLFIPAGVAAVDPPTSSALDVIPGSNGQLCSWIGSECDTRPNCPAPPTSEEQPDSAKMTLRKKRTQPLQRGSEAGSRKVRQRAEFEKKFAAAKLAL
eukprot:3318505-Rhodomonas_salina.2